MNLFNSDYTWREREAWSAAIFRSIANDLLPKSVRMKEDVPGAHPNGRLPILDTEVQILDGKITHFHYSKPMASLEVIPKRSSMSMRSKLDILTQEANRRIRNCSPSLPWTSKLPSVNRLMI